MKKYAMLIAPLVALVLLLIFFTAVDAHALSPIIQQSGPSIAQSTGPVAGGWGVLALINAGLAQGKNRKGLNWFLISLLLGPLATFLLVAFFPKLPEKTV